MIIKPGRLVICARCHKHGHIRLDKKITDGLKRGPEFSSKASGFRALNSAVQIYDLDLFESGNIRDQIRASVLPENHLQVPAWLLWSVDRWNEYLGNHGGDPSGLDIHKFVRRARRSAIPDEFLQRMDDRYEVGIHPENPIRQRLN